MGCEVRMSHNHHRLAHLVAEFLTAAGWAQGGVRFQLGGVARQVTYRFGRFPHTVASPRGIAQWWCVSAPDAFIEGDIAA